MELLLIRHALPARVEAGVGPADPPLAGLGERQAAALATALVDEGVTVLMTSPMKRARQTAASVAKELGLVAEECDGLAEYDRHSSWYIPIEELRAAKDPRWLDFVEGRWGFEHGLDPDVFRADVVRTVEALVADHPGRKVAAVAHGGVINAYVAHLLQTPITGVFEPAYTSITRILAASTGQRMVKSMNEAGHVRGLLPPGSR